MEPIRNPILTGFNPDPSICRAGDDYYIATSTFEWYPGLQIFHSRDLRDWSFVGRPLDRKELLDLTGVPDSCGVWAPCLTWADDKFWLCYTVVNRFDGDFKDTHNYLTTAPSIDGPWAPPIYMNSSGFDPSLFHDTDGRKWFTNMVWDHRPNRTYFRGIVLQEFSQNEKALVGQRKIIFDGTKTDFTEGPHLYRHGGYYYLITAEGGTGYGHAVTLARSREIWGPYEEDPELHVVTARDKFQATLQRTGHGGLVEGPDGEWYLTHLCSRPLPGLRRSPMGRESAIQKVHWTDDGWLRLSAPDEAYEAAGDLPLQELRYTFDTPDLPADFQWLRVPDPSGLFSLTERPGHLRLFGREAVGSLFHSALVARRQQHFNYTAETKLAFEPDDFQQMAGLIAYYNGHKYHYVCITHEDGVGRILTILSCAGDQSLHAQFPLAGAPIELPQTGEVWLRCAVDAAALQFSYSLDGTAWSPAGPALDASALSDEAGKGEGANFTGAFVGMACQDLTGRRLPADFAFFSYTERA